MGSQPVTLLSAFVAGLLSFLSPCVLPLIPSYLTYITGLSFADLQAEHPAGSVRRQTVLHALLFVAGFTIVFVLLGASATLLGELATRHATLLRRLGGLLVILFGCHILGLIRIDSLLGDKRVVLHRKPAGYLGSLLVGIAFAAGWTPCIGPVLASILTLAATRQDLGEGIVLLLAYSLGLGIPFVLSALGLHQFLVLFQRFKSYIRLCEIITGLLLVLVGILILGDYLTVLGGLATRWVGGGK